MNREDRSPRAEDGRLTPLRATSRAHGAIRFSTSHPEQINPPHSKPRATWGSLGQLHPIATPPPPPKPGRIRIRGPERTGEGGGLLHKTLTLLNNPTSGWAQASLARALSRSPPSGSSHMPPPSGCPKPRPGHAPKSRPRLWRGPVGREPNYKQNPRRPIRGGEVGRPGSQDQKGGCTVGRHTAWGGPTAGQEYGGDRGKEGRVKRGSRI
jgi:hypothetical protein